MPEGDVVTIFGRSAGLPVSFEAIKLPEWCRCVECGDIQINGDFMLSHVARAHPGLLKGA